jgi:hypothetical protein
LKDSLVNERGTLSVDRRKGDDLLALRESRRSSTIARRGRIRLRTFNVLLTIN